MVRQIPLFYLVLLSLAALASCGELEVPGESAEEAVEELPPSVVDLIRHLRELEEGSGRWWWPEGVGKMDKKANSRSSVMRIMKKGGPSSYRRDSLRVMRRGGSSSSGARVSRLDPMRIMKRGYNSDKLRVMKKDVDADDLERYLSDLLESYYRERRASTSGSRLRIL